MKHLSTIFLLLLISFSAKAQNFYLKIEGKDNAETKVIDSLAYNQRHENAKLAQEETEILLTALQKKGYLEAQALTHIKTNDSTFVYKFSVGQKTNTLYIYTTKLTKEQKELLDIEKDTITIPIEDTEAYMERSILLLEKKGYSISELQLSGYNRKDKTLSAYLNIKTEKLRTIDGLVVEGYTKFPEGIRKNILRQYKGKVFNQNNLQRIYRDFNAIRFVNQVRYPEILFKQDTTKVYVYLEKGKPNSFDGFIGFSNDENSNIIFNGYLDLLLNNVLNSGEKFNLFWKSDGNKQTTFNASIELPYLFKSPIGLKASLRIFKQDSTFQNTVTDLNLGYYFTYNSKLYLGYQQTQSVDIQNQNNSILSDYTSTFVTTSYEFTNYTPDDFLFPEKTFFTAKGGYGSRKGKTQETQQYFLQFKGFYNFYLNKKNIINLKNETFYLESDSYIINELYRFGGINSVRGFNENSLQANLYTALMTEYRFVLAPNIYVHSITDYGYFQDETSGIKENILGLGFGFGLLTKNGLFNIVYANGSTKGQSIKLSNSIVHLSFKTTF